MPSRPFAHSRGLVAFMSTSAGQAEEIQRNREASMKATAFAALLFGSTLAAGTAAAQPAPFNEIGVTMGHWHLISKDVEANKKIFLAMGGKLFMPGGNPLMMFPGIYINLNLGTEKGDGGSEGSVVNHVKTASSTMSRSGSPSGSSWGCRCCRAPTTGWTRPSSRRRTACASRSWRTRRNRCRSGASTSTSG